MPDDAVFDDVPCRTCGMPIDPPPCVDALGVCHSCATVSIGDVDDWRAIHADDIDDLDIPAHCDRNPTSILSIVRRRAEHAVGVCMVERRAVLVM